jgi:magnesium-transporting ATPase (P-type)
LLKFVHDSNIERCLDEYASPINFLAIRKKFQPSVQVFPFSSDRKRMGTLIYVQEEDNSNGVFTDKNGFFLINFIYLKSFYIRFFLLSISL